MLLTITDIKKTRRGRYSIYADYRFLLTVDEETLVRAGIKAGDSLEQAEIDALVGESVRRKARDKALTLLSYRDHSKAELKAKLARTAGDDAAAEAADEMEELGLVRDDAFAAAYAKELFYRRLYGRERVVYEMLRKGLDRELIERTLDGMEVDTAELLRRFLAKKYPRGLRGPDDRRRAGAALQRNGYAWEEIRGALRELEEDDAR